MIYKTLVKPLINEEEAERLRLRATYIQTAHDIMTVIEEDLKTQLEGVTNYFTQRDIMKSHPLYKQVLENRDLAENLTHKVYYPASASRTPWGMSQSKEIFATTRYKPIYYYTTASHGGFKVPLGLMKQYFRPEFQVEGGYYEEDCEWCKVVIELNRLLPKGCIAPCELKQAQTTCSLWFSELHFMDTEYDA